MRKLLRVLAWLAVWGATLTTSTIETSALLDTGQHEGFSAMLAMYGVFFLMPVGLGLSQVVAGFAREPRDQTLVFVAGAAITGLGTVPLVLGAAWSEIPVVCVAVVGIAVGLIRQRAERRREAQELASASRPDPAPDSTIAG